jgi:hypothetical protein
LIPKPLINLPKIAESDVQTALSEVEGRAIKLCGNGLSPIEILGEPILDENPWQMTLSMTEPVNPGHMDEQVIGESASYETVLVDELINNSELTKSAAARTAPEETLHIAEESEFHLVDSHEHPEKDIDCVIERTPKRMPMTDKVCDPVLAAFRN